MNALRRLTRVPTSCSRFLRQMSDESKKRGIERSINEVRLLGRIGNDPELRGANEETAVATFNLATNAVIKNEAGDDKKVTWHRIVVFNSNLKKYVTGTLKKGDRVFISGKLDNRDYQTKEGDNRRITSVAASQIINVTNRRFTEAVQDSDDYDEEQAS